MHDERAFELEGEQTFEEGPVALKTLAQIFGRYVVALGPLLFQPRAFTGELLSDAFDLDYVGDEAVCPLDSLTGLVRRMRSGSDPSVRGSYVIRRRGTTGLTSFLRFFEMR